MQFLGPILSFVMFGRSGVRRMASARSALCSLFVERPEIKTYRNFLKSNPHKRCSNDVDPEVGGMIYLVYLFLV